MNNIEEQINPKLSTNSNSTSISEQESNKSIEDIIPNNDNDNNESQNQTCNQLPPNINSNKELNINFSLFSLTKKVIITGLRNRKTSFMLQKVLNEAPKEQIDNIVKELKGNYWELIREKNGNYFCSDLFKICDQNQRILILNELSKTISNDCTNKYANYPIQTLINFASSEQEYELILNSFHDFKKLFYAAFNSFGSYVIQKIIERIPEKFRLKFDLLFILIIPHLSLKQYGVCCVKKFVSSIKNEDLIDKIINIILANFVQIATNNYGNFVIQFMLKKWVNTKYGNKIKRAIRDNFNLLYTNKYSYYICDLYLIFSSKEEKEKLMTMCIFNGTNSSFPISNTSDIFINNINNQLFKPINLI